VLGSSALGGCRGVDLYGARCGVLHTFSASSDLGRDGRAKQVIYAWGTGDPEALRRAGRHLGRDDVVVHLSDLLDAFVSGLDKYFAELFADPVRWQQATASANWYVNLDKGLLDGIVKYFPDTRRGTADPYHSLPAPERPRRSRKPGASSRGAAPSYLVPRSRRGLHPSSHISYNRRRGAS
jgi:hypothetical protein